MKQRHMTSRIDPIPFLITHLQSQYYLNVAHVSSISSHFLCIRLAKLQFQSGTKSILFEFSLQHIIIFDCLSVARLAFCAVIAFIYLMDDQNDAISSICAYSSYKVLDCWWCGNAQCATTKNVGMLC